MGILHDSFSRFVVPFLYTFVDMCFALTIISDSGSADVFCDRRNQTAPGEDELPLYCQNGGSCTPFGCHCEGSFYGTVCQHSVINAVIVVVVCILPPASWTMVFCYGCKERRRKRRIRQLRRQRQAANNSSSDNLSPAYFADDLPPSYSEIAHNNPIALCGMDDEPYQTYTDGPPPPDYDSVLKKAIECGALLPLQAITRNQDTTQCIPDNDGVQQETQICNISPSSSSMNVDETREPHTSHSVAIVTTIDETVRRSRDVTEEESDSCVHSRSVSNDNPIHSSRQELIEDTDEDEDMGVTNMAYCHHNETPKPSVTLPNKSPDRGESCTVFVGIAGDAVSPSNNAAADDSVMNTSQEDLIGADSDDED